MYKDDIMRTHKNPEKPLRQHLLYRFAVINLGKPLGKRIVLSLQIFRRAFDKEVEDGIQTILDRGIEEHD
jgi:hypothetical protein